MLIFVRNCCFFILLLPHNITGFLKWMFHMLLMVFFLNRFLTVCMEKRKQSYI